MAKTLKKPSSTRVNIFIPGYAEPLKFQVGRNGIKSIRNLSSQVPQVTIEYKNGTSQEFVGFNFIKVG